MKHVYRAYPASTKSVQSIASLVVGGSILARGISHDARVNGALLGITVCAIAVQGIRFIPGRVVVGDDGVLVRWFWSTTFVRRSAIASIGQPNDTRLRILKKDGSVCELELMSAKSASLVRAEIARLGERAATDGPQPRRSAVLEALAARALAWARAPAEGASAETSPASVAYRSGDSPEQLWDIAADVDAPALARVGAVHALGPLDDEARTRVRELAESSADPLTAGALDAAARGDLARMRAFCTGRVADASHAGSGSPLSDARGVDDVGVRQALLHPNRPLLGLAWLSRLWFVAPAIAVASSSATVGFLAFMACAIGAMPWAAAREGDPLVRVVPGRVGVEDGFVVQEGERVLELSTVTAAYVHYRVGAPPVVRFEGRWGWPLLDVRLETLDEARAFLRGLPLRDDQRDAKFGTMHPGAARFIALAVAGVAVAAIVALTHMNQPHLLAALGGLALATARLRRLLTVKRDGLLIRSPWGARFIPFEQIAEVERRKNAGVVVLRSGERVMLRSVAGELTDVVDDDLTETVIDRLEEMRAAEVVRARVADEPITPAVAPESVDEDDERALETLPDEAKRRALPPMDER